MSVTVPDSPSLQIVDEPMLYRERGEHSYFQDLILFTRRGDPDAAKRLARHADEMRTGIADRERRAAQIPTDETGRPLYELRVTPNWSPGTGGYFAPPLWLDQAFAPAPRAERVVAALARSFPLPQGVQSVNVPKLTTGTLTGVTPLDGPAPTRDIVDTAVSSPVVTIAGNADVPLPMLEQSQIGAALDWAIFTDMIEDYDLQLETQLVAGSGTPGQLAGLLTVARASNQIVYTDAAPTGSKMFPFLGQMFAAVSNSRKIRPEAWLFRGGRWAWLASSEDSSGLPLSIPVTANPIIEDPSLPNPVGGPLGIPLFTDEAIPTALGVTANQDVLIAFRPSDAIVLESEPHTDIMEDVVGLTGTLEVRLQLRRYAAALLGRYPSSVSTLSGSGMVVPANF